ncbi:flavin reductase family protein [Halovivax gelatinilyticus]|uniref:flavin reductase family protein n=1 Tax=Halovivax gelatinilyticus TaxID=2961597 RepID=UPI0020CA6DBC|nr:flavin reductase family protein [Halovivax gelatinilyticus]
MTEHTVSDLTPRERGRIVKSAVSPRPIAWISTRSRDGVDNLAPFSAYNYVSSAEPVVSFSVPAGDRDELKDTPRNVLETGEFAVNVASEALAEEMDATSASLDSDESEFDFADVERAPCTTIDPPRVAGAAVTMECTLYGTMTVHDRLLTLGDVRHVHVSDRVQTDGQIDAEKLANVGRLGGPFYTDSEIIELQRQF